MLLVMAIWRRGKPDALLHHSDRGSQYTSEQFQRLVADNGVIRSMSRSGTLVGGRKQARPDLVDLEVGGPKHRQQARGVDGAGNPLAVLYLRVSTIEQTTANQERELLGPGEVGPRMRFS